MLRDPARIEEALERILLRVEKPGRYTGGEFNSIRRDWASTPTRVALCFPDVYDIGMPNLGLAIFYDLINRQPDMLAERVYLPWPDMQAHMREQGIPLYSLESKRPILDFDLLAVTLPYEQLYTNLLGILNLAGMPLWSEERDERYPLVIAGGHACYNPEPISGFVDCFVIGEGEDAIVEIPQRLAELRGQGASRHEQLRALAQLPGVYVPRFYELSYRPDGHIESIRATEEVAPYPVMKRIVPQLPPPPVRFIVPQIETVHNRAPIEIMRGCTRGCRFCHAGMVTRPVRERPVAEIVEAVEQAIRNTGFEEVALLSLSSSDYTHILDLVRAVGERFAGRHLSISLPSLRIETASADLMELLRDNKRSGFTFAPEAATERMRNIINKTVSDAQLLDTVREVYTRGWRSVKLYFMIGHPAETIEDVQAIAELAKAVLREGRKVHGNKASVNVGVSTFIPKPHTPFQWAPMDSFDQIRAKQRLLKDLSKVNGLSVRWNRIDETLLEGLLSRGDRRLGPVIARAWELGCQFDAWMDQHNPDGWVQAMQEFGLDWDWYSHRTRSTDEVLPWDHISMAVHKRFLVRDFEMSQREETRHDCRDGCFACGILPTFASIRRETPDEAWECPPVSRRQGNLIRAADIG